MSDERRTSQRPLRLLSLDGGGIRGYSELKILQLLMHRIAWDQELDTDKSLRPCEYFDLIGGTSTGGIIAVLLGRMGLTVDDCLNLYSTLAKDVFGELRWGFGIIRSKYDAEKLKEVVIKTLDAQGFSKEELMLDIQDNETESSSNQNNENASSSNQNTRPAGLKTCRTFVSATPGTAVQRNRPHLFRSYEPRGDVINQNPNVKIWEAVRATSAAPTFFDPIHINGEEYVDGGLGCNNPCKEVYEEAQRLWPDREIGCIISLGTGMPRVLSMQNPSLLSSWWPKDWTETLLRVATLCDQIHQEMLRKRELRGKYFRFNVQQGMQTISLEEWKKLGEVATHTEVYLRDADVAPKVNQAIEKILASQDPIEEPDDIDRDDAPHLPSYAESRASRP